MAKKLKIKKCEEVSTNPEYIALAESKLTSEVKKTAIMLKQHHERPP